MCIAFGLSVPAGGARSASAVAGPDFDVSSLLLASSSTMPAVPIVLRTGGFFLTDRPARVGETEAGALVGWGMKSCGPIFSFHSSASKAGIFWLLTLTVGIV